MKKALCVAAALLIVGLVAGPSFADPCGGYAFCSDQGTATNTAGRSFDFAYQGGQGLPGGSGNIDLTPSNRVLGSFTFDSNGNFNASVEVPCDLAAGDYNLRALGSSAGGGQLTVSAPITLGASCTAGGTLSSTGSNSLPIALGGLAVIVLGATGVGIARRRWIREEI